VDTFGIRSGARLIRDIGGLGTVRRHDAGQKGRYSGGCRVTELAHSTLPSVEAMAGRLPNFTTPGVQSQSELGGPSPVAGSWFLRNNPRLGAAPDQNAFQVMGLPARGEQLCGEFDNIGVWC